MLVTMLVILVTVNSEISERILFFANREICEVSRNKPSRKFPNLLYLLDSFLLFNIYFTSEYSVSDKQEHDMVGKETK